MSYFIHRTLVKLQVNALECGAVCLAIILEYFHIKVSLGDLRTKTKISRNGGDCYSLIETSKSFGLEATAKSLLINDLKRIKYPCILFVDNGHFIVFEGFRFGSFYVNDPSIGRYKLTKSELNLRYSHVAIIFEPKYEKYFFIKRILSNIFPKSKIKQIGNLWIFTQALGFCSLFILLSINVQLFIRLLLGFNDGRLFYLGLVMFATIILFLILLFGSYFNDLRNQYKTQKNVHIFIDEFFKLIPDFFSLRPVTIFNQALINMYNVYHKFLSIKLLRILLLFLMLTSLLMLLFISRIIFFMSLIFLALFFLIFYFIDRELYDKEFSLNENINRFHYNFRTSLSYIHDLTLIGQNQVLYSKYLQEEIRINNLYNIYRKYLNNRDEVIFNLEIFAVLCLSFVAANQLYLNRITWPDIVMIFFLYPTLIFIFKCRGCLFDNSYNLNKYESLNKEMKSFNNGKKLVNIIPSNSNQILRIENLNHKFIGSNKLLLNNLNFSINENEIIGLVSKPMAGKSSLLKILSQELNPLSGIIHCRENLRSALIDDYSRLFPGTLFDNISLFDRKILEDKIFLALKTAHVTEVFFGREDGLFFKILENGQNLSVGQQKRLLLARVLAHKPQIIFLDDFFSSLEEPLALKIIQSLKEEGVSILATFKRVSELFAASRIFWLNEEGKIITGTHEELKKKYKDYLG